MSRKRPISALDECNNNDTETQSMKKKRRTAEQRLEAILKSDFTEKMITPSKSNEGQPTSRFGRTLKLSISPQIEKDSPNIAEQSSSLSKRKVRKVFSIHNPYANAQCRIRLVSNRPTTALDKSPIQKLISHTKIGLNNDDQFQNKSTDQIIDLTLTSEPNFIIQMDGTINAKDSLELGPVDVEDNVKAFQIEKDYPIISRSDSLESIDKIDLTTSTEGSEDGNDNDMDFHNEFADTRSNAMEIEELELDQNDINLDASKTVSSSISNASQNKTESPKTFAIHAETDKLSITLTDCVRSSMSMNSDALMYSDKPFSEGASDDCVIADADDDNGDFDQIENLNVGKIVWAALYGYPFWPAMVFNSTDEHTFRKGNLIHVKFLYDNGRRNWVNEETSLLPYRGREEFIERCKQPANRSKAYRFKIRKTWELAIHEANVLLCVKREKRIDFYDTILMDVIQEMESELRSNRRRTRDRCDTPKTIDTAYSSLKRSLSPASLSPTLNELDSNYYINNYLKSVELSQPEELPGVDLQMDEAPPLTLITESLSSNEPIHCRLTVQVLKELRDDEICVNQHAISNYNKFINCLNELSVRMTDLKHKTSLNTSSSTALTSRRLSMYSTASGSSSNTQANQTKRQKELAKKKAKIEAEKLNTTVVEKPTPKNKPAKEELKQRKLQLVEETIRGCNIKSHPANFLLKGLAKDPVCQCCLESGTVIKCAGQCSAYFHKECLFKELNVLEYETISKKKMRNKMSVTDSTSSIVENTEKQKCSTCTASQSNRCFVCSKSDDQCIQCCEKNCGKAYHIDCLKYWPQHKLTYAGNKIKSFHCSRHTCHTCICVFSSDIKNTLHSAESDKKLIKCLLCPGTYHRSSECIPAGSQLLSESQLICARHQKTKPVNIDFCLFCSDGGKLVCCDTCANAFHADCLPTTTVGDHFICDECESGRRPLNGDIVWCKYSLSPWWPAIIVPPPRIPDRVLASKKDPHQICVYFFGEHNYGWVTQAQIYYFIEDDVHGQHEKEGLRNAITEAREWYQRFNEINEKSTQLRRQTIYKKPSYRNIKTNRVLAKFNVGECNECKCRPDDVAPCSIESNCYNAMLNYECDPTLCAAKEKCQNQNFRRGEQFAFRVKMTIGRGWGLFAEEEIPIDRFIIEYMGEVIDAVEFDQRFSRATANKDDNYYFLTLGNYLYIDAKEYGNRARFINHSCDPNAAPQKWTVYSNGQEHIRIGFFALRTILPGEEITFDYNWGTENMKTSCQCNSKKCRGTINK